MAGYLDGFRLALLAAIGRLALALGRRSRRKLLPAAGTAAPARRVSGKRAFAARGHRVHLLLLRPEGDHRCAGGSAHCAAISAPAGGRGALAATTARYAAALPHLALSAPCHSGNARLYVSAGLACPCR